MSEAVELGESSTDFLREDEFDDSQESSTSAAARPNLPCLNENLVSVDSVDQVDASFEPLLHVSDDELSLEVDPDSDLMRDCSGFSSGEEIPLSSDSEEEDGAREVQLVCLKRPPLITESTIECLDILESDEEYPVCVPADTEKPENLNVEEKKGFIKEYIEAEGCGIIYSADFGLCLFHLNSVWLEGENMAAGRTRDLLPPGTDVSYYDQSFTGVEAAGAGTDGVLHQALVVWTGVRPRHLLKRLDCQGMEDLAKLQEYRKNFLLYLRGEVFLPLALVRVKGYVAGWISQTMGVIESKNAEGRRVQVLFHIDDVIIFKRRLWEQERRLQTRNRSLLLPVGLSLTVDARRVTSLPRQAEIDYQAVCVLAGSWPRTPYPTLLPGGPGSHTETSDLQLPPDSPPATFYYLELCLESCLNGKLDQVREVLDETEDRLRFLERAVQHVEGPEDSDRWRQQFTDRPRPKRPADGAERPRPGVHHVFKAPPVRVVKSLKEEDDVSSVATAGGSRASSISGVSSMSRPVSRQSVHSYSSGQGGRLHRTWYSASNWVHGGLRLKTELKSEPGSEAEEVKVESDCDSGRRDRSRSETRRREFR